MPKLTKEEVDAILDRLPEEEKTVRFETNEEGETLMIMDVFLLNFANAVYKYCEVDEKKQRIKLLTEEVAWAENGYRTR
jgi:hypothetical protein